MKKIRAFDKYPITVITPFWAGVSAILLSWEKAI